MDSDEDAKTAEEENEGVEESTESEEEYNKDDPRHTEYSFDHPFTEIDLENARHGGDPTGLFTETEEEPCMIDDADEFQGDSEEEASRRYPFILDHRTMLRDVDETTKNHPSNFIPDFKKGLHPDLKCEADLFYRGDGSEYEARDITVITREEWGALPLPEGNAGLTPLVGPVRFVNMEYTSDTATCLTKRQCKEKVREMQIRDRETFGLPDIRYNFLIGGDGNVYEGRGWHLQPAEGDELPQYHGKYLELVYIGDYTGDEMQTPNHTSGQFSLVKLGLKKGFIHELWMFIRKNVCHVKLGRIGFGRIDLRTGEILQMKNEPVREPRIEIIKLPDDSAQK